MRMTDSDHGITDADTIDESLFVLIDGEGNEWRWAIERPYLVQLDNGEKEWEHEVIEESGYDYLSEERAEQAAEQRKDEIIREMLKKSR